LQSDKQLPAAKLPMLKACWHAHEKYAQKQHENTRASAYLSTAKDTNAMADMCKKRVHVTNRL